MELQLTAQVAALSASVDGFAKDTLRRLDRIETQTTATNGKVISLDGRVTSLEKMADAEDALRAISDAPKQTPVIAPAVITLNDIKWWLAIAVGASTAGAGFTVWLLKLVGKL